jgi:hypothetical protein
MKRSNELAYNYPGVHLILSKLFKGPSNVQSGNATTNTAVVLPDHQLLSTDRNIEGRDRARGLHGDRRRQRCLSGDRRTVTRTNTRNAREGVKGVAAKQWLAEPVNHHRMSDKVPL